MILGHAHPDVVAAVTAAAGPWQPHSVPRPLAEVELAEQNRRAGPGGQGSGWSTRAPRRRLSAVRLARAFTGKATGGEVRRVATTVMWTRLLVAAGSGGGHVSACRNSPGVTGAAASDTLVLALQTTTAAVAEGVLPRTGPADRLPDHRGPARPTWGVVPPEPGFNELLAQICAEHGALLVMDEVAHRVPGHQVWLVRPGGRGRGPDDVRQGDGRRAARGGVRRGGAEIMDLLAPPRPGLPRRGTLSGNPLATAAGPGHAARPARRRCTHGWTRAAAEVAKLAAEALGAAGVPFPPSGTPGTCSRCSSAAPDR